MKRILLLSALLALLLCGCGKYDVARVKETDFQFIREQEEYVLTFGFADQAGQEVAAPAKVAITIEDDFGNVIYKGKQKITESDFENRENQVGVKHLLARVRIPAEDIAPGKSVSGTVNFKIGKQFSFSFDGLSCRAESCFPVQDVTFQCAQMGQEVLIKDEFWHSESRYRVENISWLTDSFTGTEANVSLVGQKVLGSKGTGADKIRYEITDQDKKVIQTGELYLGKFTDGEPFSADIYVDDLVPGDTYFITLKGTEES